MIPCFLPNWNRLSFVLVQNFLMMFFSLHKPLYSFNICPLLKSVRLHFDLDLGQPS